MKFGSKLESFLIKEWANKYIRYKYLNRLLKSAYRFKKNKTAGLDEEDIKLQYDLFSVKSLRPEQNDEELSDKNDYMFPSFEETPVEKEEHEFNIESGLVVVEIPPDDDTPTQSNKSFENLSLVSKKDTYIHNYSIESEEVTNVIKMVVETFEEKGHLDFDNIPQIKKSVSHLSKSSIHMESKVGNSLKRLDKVEFEDVISNKSKQSFGVSSVDDVSRESEHSLIDLKEPSEPNDYFDIQPYYHTKNFRSKKSKLNKKSFFGNLSMFRHFGTLKSELPLVSVVKGTFRRKKEGSPYCLALFDKSLRDDIRMVVMHYSSEMEYIQVLINYLKQDIINRSKSSDESYIKLAQKAITVLWDSSDKLISYLNMNTLAVYKLLKKKDKLLETNDLQDLYPRYKEIFHSVDSFNEINKSILDLYNLVSEPKQVDFLKMKQDVESSLDSNFIPAYYLFYIMGMCTILFLINVILCSVNFGLDVKYSTLISQLPIFRVYFIFGMIWCGIGWCQNYLETYGVNYQFLFQLSNNYSVTDNDFYFFGALQTFLCLLLFSVFLLDCKLSLFGNHNLHYIYPILLILSSFVIVLLPKKNFKLKLRRKMLYAIFRSFTSPVCIGPPVSLADSILADVYTSLSRPFVDIVYIFSYFIYGIANDSNIMHPGLTRWAVPVVMIIPFFLRFSQCTRRYIKEHLWLHIGNMGKYMSAIICVIVSSSKWENLKNNHRLALITTCYFAATLYNFLWDFFIDWGLSVPPNLFLRRNDRKMYNKNAYYLACIFNFLCRFTWALTVSPFKLMEDYDLSVNILIFIISLVEIFRRIVWVTFRLETEHLLNSYKYRTALWVPKLYKCKSVIVKELSILNK